MSKRLRETFDKVHAENILKEHTKDYLLHKTAGYRAKQAHPYRRAAAVFACLFLLFTAGGYSMFFTSAYTISVDVNPSIELNVNRFGRVISTNAYNEDGNTLLISVNVRFLDYRDALRQLLDSERMSEYNAENSFIAITVFGTDQSKCDEMQKSLAVETSQYENVHCSSGNADDVAAAHSEGMSCGKYQAYLELKELDADITADEVRELTMRQIRNKIWELSGKAETDNSVPGDTEASSENGEHMNQSNGHCGDGNGQHRGNGNGAHGGNGRHGGS